MMMATMLAAALASAAAPGEDMLKPVDVPVPPVAAAPARPVRYCFLTLEEDGRMPGKICKTRVEWRWRGIDPLAYLGRGR
ncbi:hypothetical protein [uncultured Sphingomonas sp.]|uniref:hypothetical protein n=1 Tax=uncultured Sphingomonas sp. TaxID=158754 RepID=UPI0025F1F751|nr:hypothetical protein [uncultured Sphingomonas sp.]